MRLKAPAFWQQDRALAPLLSPLSALATTVTSHRTSRSGWRAPVPVVCCGGITAGGAGKTTLVLDLARRLIARSVAVHVLSRGFGGTARGPRQVQPDDPASLVGDEPILLAKVAPTWIGGNRAESARLAVDAGAEVILMDDGLQNPTLVKDLSLLTIDGATGLGNARVFPAGPLREPVSAGALRCQAAVLIGDDGAAAAARLPRSLPVLRARLAQDRSIESLRGQSIVAFAGIAIPGKFFGPLARVNPSHLETFSFPDHHVFRRQEMNALTARARELGAMLVTTPKDAVRLPADLRPTVTVIDVRLEWDDPITIESLLNIIRR